MDPASLAIIQGELETFLTTEGLQKSKIKGATINFEEEVYDQSDFELRLIVRMERQSELNHLSMQSKQGDQDIRQGNENYKLFVSGPVTPKKREPSPLDSLFGSPSPKRPKHCPTLQLTRNQANRVLPVLGRTGKPLFIPKARSPDCVLFNKVPTPKLQKSTTYDEQQAAVEEKPKHAQGVRRERQREPILAKYGIQVATFDTRRKLGGRK